MLVHTGKLYGSATEKFRQPMIRRCIMGPHTMVRDDAEGRYKY